MLPSPAGVVFDLDGTLVDNLGFHGAAFARIGRDHGLRAPDGPEWLRMMGRRNSDVFESLFGRRLDAEEFARFEVEKEALYRWWENNKVLVTSEAILALEETLGELGDTVDRCPALSGSAANGRQPEPAN